LAELLRYKLEDLLASAGVSIDTSGTESLAREGSKPFKVPETIRDGDRHEMLYKLLRSQKARNISMEAALATCYAENKAKCNPPIEFNELDKYLRRVWEQPDSPDFQRREPANRPAITIHAGDKNLIVSRAEDALLPAGTIYQRGGMLTRIVRQTPIGTENIRREANCTVCAPVTENWLLEQMGRTAEWLRPVTKKEPTRIDPPAIYARTLMERREWKFPTIRAIVKAPTLAHDGRILQRPGFDEASGLYLDIPSNYFPPVAEHPTIDDALAAARYLEQPLRGFPFVSDAAKSVALAAILTALIRGSLQTSPLHAYDAPTAGTGKSLLAELVGLVATGVRPPAMSQGKTEDEDEKRMSTVLFAGDPVIHLDNCERPISGDFLCSMLTQAIVQARILGKSERRILPSTALVLASGNNLALAGDVSRRAVICRLDAGMERPDQRAFDFDCHAEALAIRPQLAHAGLTLLRAYDVAGRPVKLTPMGSFTDWEWVRGALVWVGIADPADTREAIFDSDPRKDELVSVMDLWATEFGEQWTDVAAVGSRRSAEPYYSDLCVMFSEVACHGGKWSGKSVGRWLTRNKDRVVSGRAFECRDGGHSKEWRLKGAQGVLMETE